MVKTSGRSPPRASVVWIAPPTTIAFATPKSLNGVVLAVFATATLLLAGFFIYMYQRRKLRAVSSRTRRGKGVSGLQQPMSDADVIYDDGRRGPRAGTRRNWPWPLSVFLQGQRAPLFPDSQRGFSFPLDLDRLWSGVGPAVVEATVDDLADVLPYTDSGRPSASGPRFMATTASGKSLQVIVKTAAVAARQQQGDRQTSIFLQQDSPTPPHVRPSTSWQDAGPPSGRQLPSSASQGAVNTTTSLPLTPALSNGSGGSDVSDGGAATTPFSSTAVGGPTAGTGRGPTLRSAGAGGGSVGAQYGGSRSGDTSIARHDSGATTSAGAGAAVNLDTSDDDGYTVLQHGASAGRHSTYGDALPGGGTATGPQSQSGASGAAAPGAAGQAAGAGTAGAGVGSVGLPGGSFGRGSDVDPAAAWYSRALHRQVSAATALPQANVPAPKVHLA